jgi:iron(III) transport system ATP-binding protein
MTFLQIRSLHKSYGAAHALAGVSMDIPQGSRTAIVGPSGSGKTTLLRILAGFEVPDAGSVTLGGQLLADASSAVPAHLRGIGYVPQDGALFPHLRIADNVGFGLERNMAGRDERIAELMDMVALDRAMLQRYPHELSGGQQQRVALARALAQRPQLMLMDEPFSALDTGLRASTRKAVTQLLDKAGITTILVTHDQGEALSFADQVGIMRCGLLLQAGTPMELYLRPVDAGTAEFLGDTLVMQAHLTNGLAQCALGRVAVDNKDRSGAATIMLRPEQLQFEVVQADARQCTGEDASCLGLVEDVDFYGPTCDLSVHLHTAPDQAPIHIRSAGLLAPARGATVQVSVTGVAHVFAD